MAIMCIPLLPQREMSIGEFRAWLRRFDYDHDGRLTREELQLALESLRGWGAWWRARRGMKEADTNGDGVIDKDEVLNLVEYAERHLHMKIHGAKK